MENRDKRYKLIQEYLETALIRNKKHLLIICEDVTIPESAIVQSINTGFDDIVFTSYLRQDDTPILIKGDMVVTHKNKDESD